jgi:ornithine cyclodeaminase/alanine dehydrogenase-like protein (mu-crystallin family)
MRLRVPIGTPDVGERRDGARTDSASKVRPGLGAARHASSHLWCVDGGDRDEATRDGYCSATGGQAYHHHRVPIVLLLDETRVRELLTLDALLPAMERALIDFSAGRVRQPVRGIIPVPEHEGLFGYMPAVWGDIMGAKLVSMFHRNPARGLPSHLATIQIFRSSTGEPLATMDGRLITELRTAAVSAVATRLLARQDAHILAVLGSGVQADSHVRALKLVRSFDDIRVWSRSSEHAERFARSVGARAMGAEDAVRGADVVVTVTSSPVPVLRGSWLGERTMVNAVGAVGPSRRELDDEALRGPVVVDSREAAGVEAGDLLLAKAPVYAELGELLARTKPVPTNGPIVFKSLGIAVEDLAAAQLVYEAAIRG